MGDGESEPISPVGSPVVRQWHTPILVESARSDLDPRRRVATVLEAGGVLKVALNDIVEHFVGW